MHREALFGGAFLAVVVVVLTTGSPVVVEAGLDVSVVSRDGATVVSSVEVVSSGAAKALVLLPLAPVLPYRWMPVMKPWLALLFVAF